MFADADGSILITLLEQSLETLDGIELSQSFGSNGEGCYTLPTPGESNTICMACFCAIGDINCDGGWNVLDIVSLANCVLADSCGGRVDDASGMYFFKVEATGNVNV